MISRLILLDDILNIYNIYFDNMVSQIHTSKSSNLIKLVSLIPFLDLQLSISNGIVSTKNFNNRGDF